MITQELMNFGTIQEEASQFPKVKKTVLENRAIYLFIYLCFSKQPSVQSDKPRSISKRKYWNNRFFAYLLSWYFMNLHHPPYVGLEAFGHMWKTFTAALFLMAIFDGRNATKIVLKLLHGSEGRFWLIIFCLSQTTSPSLLQWQPVILGSSSRIVC